MKNCSFEMPPAYSPVVLGDVCQLCGITNQYPVLARTAETISNDAVLAEYACKLYKEFTTGVNSFSKHLVPVDKLGDAANQIFFLTVLSAIPTALKRYRSQETPEDIIAATLNFSGIANSNGDTANTIKFHPCQVGYCRSYYKAEIYQLGRFHFKLHKDKRDLPAVVINRKNPSQKVLLAADQTFCDDRGFVDNEKPTWLTRASLSEKSISGNIINADGTAGKECAEFSSDEWSWQYGARTVIDMHIPAGGGMKPEISRESLKKAFRFFSGKAQVIYCNSWILNPDLQGLAGTDNMTALMKMGHLFPVRSGDKEGMFFLFGYESDDFDSLPQETTLQRSAVEFMKKGGKLRAGGIFFFDDEI